MAAVVAPEGPPRLRKKPPLPVYQPDTMIAGKVLHWKQKLYFFNTLLFKTSFNFGPLNWNMTLTHHDQLIGKALRKLTLGKCQAAIQVARTAVKR